MRKVYANIEIINGAGIALKRLGNVNSVARRINSFVLVETNLYMLAINENIQEQLQFPVVEKRKAQLSDGSKVECDVVAPVETRFNNRRSTC